MARLRTRLSTCAATIALTVLAGAGSAVAEPAVDKDAGPVSYANPASLEVLSDQDPATEPARLITETQRSPLGPGTSRLDQAERSTVPEKGDETGIVPNYRIDLGEHKVVAALGKDHVPSASAETDYTLDYLTPAGTAKRVLSFTGARTAVACGGVDSLSRTASAASLRVLDSNGGLEEVPLPRGDASVTRTDLPFGPAVDIEGMDNKDVSSDITISRINSFDQLLRQDEWRDGPVTAVSGWQVQIVTHITPSPREGASARTAASESSTGSGDGGAEATASGNEADTRPAEPSEPSESSASDSAVKQQEAQRADVASTDIRTRIVLGGVSCSIPSGFVPASTDSGGGAAANNVSANSKPDVPVTVRAGGHAWSTGTGPAGYWVIGGGLLAGATAMVLFARTRRRRAGTALEGTGDPAE